jgi:hypothetical protein
MSGTLRDNRGQKKPEFQVGQTVYAIKSRTHYGSADVVEYQIEKIASDPQWMSAYTMVREVKFGQVYVIPENWLELVPAPAISEVPWKTLRDEWPEGWRAFDQSLFVANLKKLGYGPQEMVP